MLTVTNEEVNMSYKVVTNQVVTIVGNHVELITSIETPKVSLEVYPYVGKPSIT